MVPKHHGKVKKSEESLGMMEQRILSRLTPGDREQLLSLLRNAVLFIKKMRGETLSEEEEIYPSHPMLSHTEYVGGHEAAETLFFRLTLIDQYQLNSAKYIEEILKLDYPAAYGKKLTPRKAQIIHELYENPQLPKYKLAKKVRTSTQILNRELSELQNEFAFQIISSPDPQKFRLVNKVILFRAKSTRHSERLEDFLRIQEGYHRSFQLDRDMINGILLLRYPDQPEAHRMFEEKVRWLQDEFFIDSFLIHVTGFHYAVSFTSYDPEINAYTLEPEIVSEAPFTYIKQHRDTLPKLQGCNYGEPIQFDRVDFLLAHSLYSSGVLGRIDFKQGLLKRYGIELSKKTIWKRDQQLRKKKVSTPLIDMQIPGFDEYITLVVMCTQDTCETLRAIPSFLPYVIHFTTDSGCILTIQRPTRASALTGQLVRAIHKEPGVSDVKLLRYQWRILSVRHTDIVDRWNEREQKWEIHEGDI